MDVFVVFRFLGYFIGGFTLLCMSLFLAYLVEPRVELDNQKLEVVRTYWSRTINSRGVSSETFRAEIILPNGNSHSFVTYPNRIIDETYVCATIELGKWFEAYHVDVVRAEMCPE